MRFQRCRTQRDQGLNRDIEPGQSCRLAVSCNLKRLSYGFEVFRFENDRVVEHWDNLQSKPDSPNPSGHTMLEGSTEATGLNKTEDTVQTGSVLKSYHPQNPISLLAHITDQNNASAIHSPGTNARKRARKSVIPCLLRYMINQSSI